MARLMALKAGRLLLRCRPSFFLVLVIPVLVVSVLVVSVLVVSVLVVPVLVF